MLKIVEKAKLWYAISLIIIVVGMGKLAISGLNFGIDFKGGTSVVVDMGKEFNKQEVDDIVKKYATDAVTNTVETTQIEIKSNNLDSPKIAEMIKELKEKFQLKDNALVSEELIGASVGKELTNKAFIALGISTVAILLYVAVRFEVLFGISAIIALVHDVLVTLSIYALFQVPINSPFIAAILTIIGYSINDTIVIFDRIRENLKNMRRSELEEVANISVNQTMSRSINTAFTTLLTVTAVYIFVPSVRDFAFPLIIGIISGGYSSIFIASPLWVSLKKYKKARAHA